MANKPIQFPAIFDDDKGLKDRSRKITFITRELSKEGLAELLDFSQREVWIAVSESEIRPEDIKVEEVPIETGQKTPSQRLRAVIFKYWEVGKKQGKVKEDFDTFYRQQMERLIEAFKEKLD